MREERMGLRVNGGDRSRMQQLLLKINLHEVNILNDELDKMSPGGGCFFACVYLFDLKHQLSLAG